MVVCDYIVILVICLVVNVFTCFVPPEAVDKTHFLIFQKIVQGLPRPSKPSSKKLGWLISSGQDAEIADYPYTLALTWSGYPICGASLIGPKWAVTAAQYTYGMDANELTVVAGATDLAGGQEVQVAATYQNPLFDSTFDYDISVLELAEDITVANSAPIALHDSGYTAEEGTDVAITGWGDRNHLQVVVTKVVSKEVCNEAYGGKVTDRMVCAGSLEEGACYGYYGGPLVVDGKLYAIVSWGYRCRPGYPGVNSKVTEESMREFVRNVTGL